MVDFDSQSNRLSEVKECLPTELSNRVFVLGVWSEPERLTADLKQNKEQIGALLAIECLQDKRAIWNHELLKHNVPEIDRMPPELRALLFP